MGQVVKLAQPGHDVKTAGDENLIYSSLWPLLKIYKSDPMTIGDVNASQVLAEHDLGFFPMFWFFSNSVISGWNNSGTQSSQDRSEFFGPSGNGSISSTENKLIYTPTSGTTGSLNLYYYIFALDLSKQFTAPITKVGSVTGGSDPRFVFKLAKDTKNIDSNNLDDYIIHSRARSPLIHSVNPSNGTTKSFTVQHNLGYLPMFFGYTKGTNGYTLIPTGQGGSSSFQSDENKITFADSGGKEITIVILKDPFLLDYTVSVNV